LKPRARPALVPNLAPATEASRVIIDTGPLVALYARDDPGHDAAARWLAGFHGSLHTVEAVLAEAASFLPPRARSALAELATRGVLQLHHPDGAGLARMAELLRKYADLDPDWADIALVWLAESTGIDHIATLDVADFSALRIHGRRRFRLELLR
jgi:predicted nucleic acid-binding protein